MRDVCIRSARCWRWRTVLWYYHSTRSFCAAAPGPLGRGRPQSSSATLARTRDGRPPTASLHMEIKCALTLQPPSQCAIPKCFWWCIKKRKRGSSSSFEFEIGASPRGRGRGRGMLMVEIESEAMDWSWSWRCSENFEIGIGNRARVGRPLK